jgi:hypothetical protein
MADYQPIARPMLTLILALLGIALLSGGAKAQGAQRRVALVIGQSAYPGGSSATIGLPALNNPARRPPHGGATRPARLRGDLL